MKNFVRLLINFVLCLVLNWVLVYQLDLSLLDWEMWAIGAVAAVMMSSNYIFGKESR